jgi:hypothetical protein
MRIRSLLLSGAVIPIAPLNGQHQQYESRG